MQSYEIIHKKTHNLEVPGSSPGWSTYKRLISNEIEPFFVSNLLLQTIANQRKTIRDILNQTDLIVIVSKREGARQPTLGKISLRQQRIYLSKSHNFVI